MSRRYEESDALTWFQVHNAFPLVMALVTIFGSYGYLQTRMSLTEQRLDYVENQAKSCRADMDAIKNQQQLQSFIANPTLRVAMKEVKGASTRSAELLEKPASSSSAVLQRKPTGVVTP